MKVQFSISVLVRREESRDQRSFPRERRKSSAVYSFTFNFAGSIPCNGIWSGGMAVIGREICRIDKRCCISMILDCILGSGRYDSILNQVHIIYICINRQVSISCKKIPERDCTKLRKNPGLCIKEMENQGGGGGPPPPCGGLTNGSLVILYKGRLV